MEHAMRDLVALVAVLAVGVGPVAVVIGLLNRRDRRAATLLGIVCDELPAVALRSDVAIAVRCGLLAGRSTVTVDMWACSPEAVWAAMVRLRRALPAQAELRVVSRLDRGEPTRMTARRVGAGGVAAMEMGC